MNEAQLDVIIKSGIGQAKQALDRFIQPGEPAILDADAFRRSFHASIRQNNLPGLLTSFAATPTAGNGGLVRLHRLAAWISGSPLVDHAAARSGWSKYIWPDVRPPSAECGVTAL